MVYTAKPITAAELAPYGSVAAVVPPDGLRCGRARAGRRHRRQEPDDHPPGQGVAQRHRPGRRQAQLPLRAGLHLRAARARRGRRAAGRLRREARRRHADADSSTRDGDGRMADKRTTVDDIVGELRSGMTIGIGGWGSRRKPMAVVRAICRSDLTDLTVVAYGGPDVGLLCATGKVRKVVCGFVTLDSIAARPALARRPASTAPVEVMEVDEGMFFLGPPGRRVAGPLPAHPGRTGLRRPDGQPGPAHSSAPPTAPSPTGDPADADASSWPCRPCASMPPSSTPTGPTPPATARSSAPTPSSTTLFLGAADRRFVTTERIVADGTLADEAHPLADAVHPPPADRRRGRDAGRGPLHGQPARLRARRGVPEGVRGRRGRPDAEWDGLRRAATVVVDEDEYQATRSRSGRSAHDRSPLTGVTRAEFCVVACADVWRGAGEVMASPFGTVPALGARLAKLHLRPRPRPHRRRGRPDGRRAAARDAARPSSCSRPPCPTAASSTSCGRAGAT